MASTSEANSLVSNREDIAGLLAALYRQRAPVTVTFSGSTQSYVSMVVDLDREAGFFYLDELNPSSGDALLRSGKNFSVRSSAKGLSIFFSGCRLLREIKDAKGALYQVAFPQLLKHDQKRQAFRARVLSSMQAPVLLKSQARERAIKGVLVDLSHGGCNLSLPLPITPPLEAFEVIDELTLKVTGYNEAVMVSAEVRRLQTTAEGDHLECGVRFINTNNAIQSRIDHLSMFLQREALRLDAQFK